MTAAVFGCAKAVTTGPNEANIRYFDAWMEVNYPDAQPSGLGIYVIDEEEGTGAEVKRNGYAFVNYTKRSLSGDISEYTQENIAEQLGYYNQTYYYGPKVITTIDQTIQTGLLDALVGMKIGGKKEVVIPGWLMTYYVYGTNEEYLANDSGASSAIYSLEVTDFTEDIVQYETDAIDKYIKARPEIFDAGMIQPHKDTTFFFQPQSEKANPDEDEKFKPDTTILINYTGRLLNGLVFDTTIEKIGKDAGLSESKTYEPVEIHWGENYTDITMGSSSSSVIQGFAMTLWQMQNYTKGTGIFYSPLGYSYSRSGKSIPAYSPLIFEIEIVEKPEE